MAPSGESRKVWMVAREGRQKGKLTRCGVAKVNKKKLLKSKEDKEKVYLFKSRHQTRTSAKKCD